MGDKLISNAVNIKQLVSAEILEQVRDSFLQKYGVGLCIYDASGHPLVQLPDSLPSLAHLTSSQKKLFQIFFTIKDKAVSFAKQKTPIIQQFVGGLTVRSIQAIHMKENLCGFICLVDIRRFVDAEKDKDVLERLAAQDNQHTHLDRLQDDDQSAISKDFLLWHQEAHDVLQLFLEAGQARAHIDEHAVPEEAPDLQEIQTGILFCTTNGHIIEALPDAAKLLGYAAPDELCDLNIFQDLLSDKQMVNQLRLMALERKTEPVAVTLNRHDNSTVDVTLQFIPQKTGDTFLGFECHLVAVQSLKLEDVQEYERDQTAIGLIAENREEDGDFELPGHIELSAQKGTPAAERAAAREVPQAKKGAGKRESGSHQPWYVFSHLLNVTESPMLITTADGLVQFWNSPFARLLGYDSNQLQNVDFKTLVIANMHSTWRRWQMRLLKAPDGAVLKPKVLLPLVKKDASIVMTTARLSKINIAGKNYIVLSLSPAKSDPGSQSFNDAVVQSGEASRGASTDILALEALQKHYISVRKQFAQIAETLFKNISSAYIESLQNEESKKRYLAVKRIADICAQIDRNLSYFTEEISPNLTSTDINYIVKKIKARLQHFLPISIELQTSLDRTLPRIMADQDMLVHALGTVCKNAIDAMPGGGVLTIETQWDEVGLEIIIGIRDTGSGFDRDLKKQLMTPFYTTKRDSLGRGLGLAAAFGIFNAHGGTLTLRNMPDGGALATIALPARAEEKPVLSSNDEDAAKRKGFILVIDDEMDLAEATAMALTRDGYFVITSTSCPDGLSMFEMYRDEIDIIVIDNHLIGATGLECAKKICELDENAQFVFYSGADDDNELARFIKETGSGWLPKPFKTQELIAEIERRLVRS